LTAKSSDPILYLHGLKMDRKYGPMIKEKLSQRIPHIHLQFHKLLKRTVDCIPWKLVTRGAKYTLM